MPTLACNTIKQKERYHDWTGLDLLPSPLPTLAAEADRTQGLSFLPNDRRSLAELGWRRSHSSNNTGVLIRLKWLVLNANVLLYIYIYVQRFYFIFEQEEGREGKREGEKNQMVASHKPPCGPGPPLKHVPRSGKEPSTFPYTSWRSIHCATPTRVQMYFKSKNCKVSVNWKRNVEVYAVILFLFLESMTVT